jgi:tetratricopeptide (TPR) repeat protein
MQKNTLSAFITGIDVDTVLQNKIDLAKQGLTLYKEQKRYADQAVLLQKLISIKPKPTINDYFDLTVAYYFAEQKPKSREEALKMIQNYPDQVYGYEWAYNNSLALDSVKKDSIAVPDAKKLNEFAAKDTVKYRKQYISTNRYLAAYYINDAKDKETALQYFNKWLEVDPANGDMIRQYIESIKKMPAQKGNNTRPNGNPPPPKPNSKASPVKTTTKTSVVKKP